MDVKYSGRRGDGRKRRCSCRAHFGHRSQDARRGCHTMPATRISRPPSLLRCHASGKKTRKDGCQRQQNRHVWKNRCLVTAASSPRFHLITRHVHDVIGDCCWQFRTKACGGAEEWSVLLESRQRTEVFDRVEVEDREKTTNSRGSDICRHGVRLSFDVTARAADRSLGGFQKVSKRG